MFRSWWGIFGVLWNINFHIPLKRQRFGEYAKILDVTPYKILPLLSALNDLEFIHILYVITAIIYWYSNQPMYIYY